jgi:nucleotide-binding universal stress UspA family protein
VFRSILVAYDASPPARAALAHAIDIARTQNATLTVVTVAPPVTPYAALGGISPRELEDDVGSWADRVARDAVASVPDDVSVHHVERSGNVGEELVKELEERDYDLIVLGSRGRGRLETNVFGSVNAYVHYHTQTALLSVQVVEED